jgi:D-glycero-D-manno-heptose 1,7-bisphosphate phosphatase
MRQPAIFLDRDGVIIENRANYVRSWADVEIYPQALEALAQVSHSPYKIIIVTNQSVVGRGIIALSEAQSINDRLVSEIVRSGGRIDATFMCPHTPKDGCGCRKPKPGLLLQAAQAHAIDMGHSIMIGVALSDLLAGQAAGVGQVALVRTGRGAAQSSLPEMATLASIHIYDQLKNVLAALVVNRPIE